MSLPPPNFVKQYQIRAASYAEGLHAGVHVAGTQSPIEATFLAAIILLARLEYEDSLVIGEPRGDHPQTLFFCIPQAPVLDYRADFVAGAYQYPAGGRVVIECDGHDFHERTKEQARHDRRRDRRMTAAGYRVLRFTGSEIYADAFACADEVLAQLIRLEHHEGRFD